ncbi:hypothetical protein JCM13210_18620 [Thermaerobacter litoralis]
MEGPAGRAAGSSAEEGARRPGDTASPGDPVASGVPGTPGTPGTGGRRRGGSPGAGQAPAPWIPWMTSNVRHGVTKTQSNGLPTFASRRRGGKGRYGWIKIG